MSCYMSKALHSTCQKCHFVNIVVDIMFPAKIQYNWAYLLFNEVGWQINVVSCVKYAVLAPQITSFLSQKKGSKLFMVGMEANHGWGMVGWGRWSFGGRCTGARPPSCQSPTHGPPPVAIQPSPWEDKSSHCKCKLLVLVLSATWNRPFAKDHLSVRLNLY